MKNLVLLFCLISIHSFGQMISGSLVNEGRSVLNKPAFIIEGMADGFAKVELANSQEDHAMLQVLQQMRRRVS